MVKKKLLYASPFPPMKSGISDYSEKLVKVLKDKFDITLYIDNYKISNNLANEFKVLKYGISKVDYDSYDYIIYNIGNNENFHEYIYKECLAHPGVVILHDFVIFNLFYGMYKDDNTIYEKLFRCGTNRDFFQVKCMIKEGYFDINKIANIPLNGEILKSNNKIIVHSEYSYNKILETKLKTKDDIYKVNLISLDEDLSNIQTKSELFDKYNIPQDAVIVASFGNIVPTKLNKATCKAIKRISKSCDEKFCYLLVGEGNEVDDFLEDGLIIKTGYTSLEDFKALMNYSDIVVNLRYPSMGETSASMVQILKNGKCCIINADGWFAEIPSNCVYQVRREHLEKELQDAILKLIDNKELRDKIGNNARKYIEDEYNDEKILNSFMKLLS